MRIFAVHSRLSKVMKKEAKQYFVFGDIHGCAQELETLLETLPLKPSSCLIFLGDYVDRGNFSKQVIEQIVELKKKYEVIALMGNHEQLFLDFIDHPESLGAGLFILNGGGSTLASYSDGQGHFHIPESHLQFLRDLKPFFETESCFFVHAGLPEIPLDQVRWPEHADEILWVRAPFLQSEYNWKKRVIHGHSPRKEPEVRPNRINLDTGCVYDGKLTCLELPSEKFYSVQKIKKKETSKLLRPGNEETRAATRFRGSMKVYISRSGKELNFETINYNQFGLLIREFKEAHEASLSVGEKLKGSIGKGKFQKMAFHGEVVRIETRGEGLLYGIKILKLSASGEELP